ncbi:hypothetical protein VTI74DRAFT_11679 [Chaetomium olivicolor]
MTVSGGQNLQATAKDQISPQPFSTAAQCADAAHHRRPYVRNRPANTAWLLTAKSPGRTHRRSHDVKIGLGWTCPSAGVGPGAPESDDKGADSQETDPLHQQQAPRTGRLPKILARNIPCLAHSVSASRPCTVPISSHRQARRSAACRDSTPLLGGCSRLSQTDGARSCLELNVWAP